jgi:hypothetical protein
MINYEVLKVCLMEILCTSTMIAVCCGLRIQVTISDIRVTYLLR